MAPIRIDPDEHENLCRRLFALADRRFEGARDIAVIGEGRRLSGSEISTLAGDLHGCG